MTHGYDPNGNEISDGRGHTFDYDLAGNRISTKTGGTTTTYSYSGTGLLLAQNAPSGSTTYSWDENNALAQLASQTTGSGTTESFYGLGHISSRLPDGSDAYYHYDPQNSVTAVTDGAGQTQHSYDYDPFGVLRSHTDGTGAQRNSFGFAGELSDPTSGLSYMRARWYEPGTGRFTATDPLAPAASASYPSAYQYANGQPTVGADPSGMAWLSFPWLDHLLPDPSDAGMAVSNQVATALDGFTGGYSTRLAGAILGFNAECTPFGSGPAHWGGYALSFFAGVGEERAVAAGAISMDEAVARAAEFVGGEGRMIKSGSGGYQFTRTDVQANGDVITRNARFDINPDSPHVQSHGPHLNLETHVNGRPVRTGPLADPHTPIDPSTIRPGDIP